MGQAPVSTSTIEGQAAEQQALSRVEVRGRRPSKGHLPEGKGEVELVRDLEEGIQDHRTTMGETEGVGPTGGELTVDSSGSGGLLIC